MWNSTLILLSLVLCNAPGWLLSIDAGLNSSVVNNYSKTNIYKLSDLKSEKLIGKNKREGERRNHYSVKCRIWKKVGDL